MPSSSAVWERLDPLFLSPSRISASSFSANGDGISDLAIFRGSSILWAVRGLTWVYFENSTDTVASGDYNGDGTADIGIFLETTGLWAIMGLTRCYFRTMGDVPLTR